MFAQRILDWYRRPKRQKILSILSRFHRVGYFIDVKYHSFDFEGYIPRDKLLGVSADSVANATAYQSYSNFYLKTLIKEALKTGINFDNFIDIGSGKGKVCIYARRYFNFRKIIGIEFSGPLVEIANYNLSNTKYRNIEFINVDATQWKIPNGNSIVFLFNPFNQIILQKFLSANIEHFKNFNSLIMYANAVHSDVIEQFGFKKIIESDAYNSSIFKFGER